VHKLDSKFHRTLAHCSDCSSLKIFKGKIA